MTTRDATATIDMLLRLLVEQTMEHAILLLDVDGRIVWWSPGAEDIFGIPSSEAIGQPASLIFTPEDIERGIPEQEIAIARANDAAEDDRWLARPNGSRFWAAGVMIALRDEDGQLLGFGKILRNRTDQREHTETLRNQVEAAHSANQHKDLFLSTLSHELRNPLAPLANAVEIIRAIASSKRELEHPLKIIERQVETLVRGRSSSRRKSLRSTTSCNRRWKAPVPCCANGSTEWMCYCPPRRSSSKPIPTASARSSST
jgi:PAS domain S-box-containing protein